MQQHYSNIKSLPRGCCLQQHKQLAWLNESKQRLIPLKNPHHTETTVGKASTSFVKFASLFCIQWMLLSRGFLQISTSEGFTLYMQRRPRLSSMHIKSTSLIHKTTYHILSTMRDIKKKIPLTNMLATTPLTNDIKNTVPFQKGSENSIYTSSK